MMSKRLEALKEAEKIVGKTMDYIASEECSCDLSVGFVCEACEARGEINHLRRLIKKEEQRLEEAQVYNREEKVWLDNS